MPELKNIPLETIRSTAKNPRSDLVDDDPSTSSGQAPSTSSGQALHGLAASLGSEEHPMLAGPPMVEEITPGEYRILAGERRVKAARLAGWQQMPCLVHPLLDPAQAHTLRLVENLHRQELHPLDKAAALRIAWFTANADEMGLKDQARQVLRVEQAPTETLAALDALLKSAGFVPTHPAVPWDTVLDRLGLGMTPLQRKRLLRVLGIESQVQEKVRELDLSEASLRSLGTLEAEDQARLVEEIVQDPTLGRRVRRIAHAVNHHEYQLEEALAEARGQIYLDGDAPHGGAAEEPSNGDVPEGTLLENDVSDVVLELLDAANQVSVTLGALREAIGDGKLSDLPQPWDEYAQEALGLMQSEIGTLGLRTQA